MSAQGAAAAPEAELGVNEFVEIWSPSPDSCVEDPSFPLYSHIFNYGGPQVEMETNLREVRSPTITEKAPTPYPTRAFSWLKAFSVILRNFAKVRFQL